MSIVIFIIILALLVLSHEAGHFFVAKRAGIRVDEFGFGFPPRLCSVTRGETTYSINLIPFGGFVKIHGEEPLAIHEESVSGSNLAVPDPDAARGFAVQPRLVQARVVVAGIVANLLLAWILLSISFVTGMPTSVGSVGDSNTLVNPRVTITTVRPDTPASSGGLVSGDVILSVMREGESAVSIKDPMDLQDVVAKSAGIPVTITYRRGQNDTATLTLVPKEGIVPDRPAIGITMDTIGVVRLPIHRAILEGLTLTGTITVRTVVAFSGLIHDLFVGRADLTNVTGPVGLVGVVGDAQAFGFVYLLGLTAMISINLAVINLIPFPALDGGRLLFIAIEAMRRRPLPTYAVRTAHTLGFVLLLFLMLVITWNDIGHLISG